MSTFRLTDAQIAKFNEDGYLMVKDLFDREAMDLLINVAKADRKMQQGTGHRKDAQGNVSKLSLTFDLTDDIYSAIARCNSIVDPMEQLLGGEVFHFHHKMMLKEPFVGGAWEWHQDYGYWYKFEGFLFPNLASCMIAVDRANKENGCLQVIKGSHRMGRIEHGVTGGQTGADMERVDATLKHLELVHCEMEPGTAVFFHSNLLHRSDQNRSPNSRWSLICCYSGAKNPICKDVPYARYKRLEKCPDSKIKEAGRQQLEALRQTEAVAA